MTPVLSSPDAGLPFDPDLGPDEEPRGLHVQVRYGWRHFGLVLAGGTAGTALREVVGTAVPSLGAVPTATLLINVTGAFALGAVLEALTRRGADAGSSRTLRLIFGTGLLGGFTTYSALAIDTAELIQGGLPSSAALYALGTVGLGVGAAWVGLAATAAYHRLGTKARS
jgi:CrcB protein